MRKSYSLAVTFFSLTILMLNCRSAAEKPSATVEAQVAVAPQNSNVTNRQTASTPENEITKSTSLAQRIEDFAPQGWYVLAKAEGDLNSDRRADAVAIFSKSNPELSKTDESQTDEALEAPRVLIIALRDGNNQLELATKSEKVVLGRRYGGMSDEPFSSLTIDNGVIELEQSVLGTDGYEYANRIRYQQNQWLVDGGLELRDRSTGRTKSIRQKPMLLSAFDITNAFPMK